MCLLPWFTPYSINNNAPVILSYLAANCSHIIAYFDIALTVGVYNLKIPSLFTGWFFWNIHNKSHNVKDDHHFFLHIYLSEENKLLWGTVCPFGVFSRKKKHRSLLQHWGLYRDNIILVQYNDTGESDIEWHISI